MIVLSSKNVNLHSASTPGGLVHLNAGRKARVPDDVDQHPGFDMLVDGGIISVLSSKMKAPDAEILKPAKPEEKLGKVPTDDDTEDPTADDSDD